MPGPSAAEQADYASLLAAWLDRQADSKVFANVDRYGNTSAGSIPICLDEAWREGRIGPGDIVLMVGFGGGLAWGSCVMEWTKERS